MINKMIIEKWCTELLTIERKILQLESFFGLEENALKISSHEVIKKVYCLRVASLNFSTECDEI